MKKIEIHFTCNENLCYNSLPLHSEDPQQQQRTLPATLPTSQLQSQVSSVPARTYLQHKTQSPLLLKQNHIASFKKMCRFFRIYMYEQTIFEINYNVSIGNNTCQYSGRDQFIPKACVSQGVRAPTGKFFLRLQFFYFFLYFHENVFNSFYHKSYSYCENQIKLNSLINIGLHG